MNWWAQYIGRPFKDGGRGPATFDCWGLVRTVYAEQLSIDLPTYGDVSAHDMIAVARHMLRPEDAGPWVRANNPKPFDVAVFSAGPSRRIAGHVGVMIDPVRVLHIWAQTNACVMPLSHSFFGRRLLGHWRHCALTKPTVGAM